MSCPWWFGQQRSDRVHSLRVQTATTLPAGKLQPWCSCAKIGDFLGKSVAKFFSNWLLQCCLSQFGVFYVREQGQDDCCSGIIYSGGANLTVLEETITLPSPASCWLWTLSFSNILEFTSRCWNRGHYLCSHMLIPIVEPNLHFPTHLGWSCSFCVFFLVLFFFYECQANGKSCHLAILFLSPSFCKNAFRTINCRTLGFPG